MIKLSKTLHKTNKTFLCMVLFNRIVILYIGIFFPNLFINILSIEIYNVNLNTHILVKQVQQYCDKNTTSSEVS